MLNPKNVPAGATHYTLGSIMPFEKLVDGNWCVWDEEAAEWWDLGSSANNRPEGTGKDLCPAPIELFLGAV